MLYCWIFAEVGESLTILKALFLLMMACYHVSLHLTVLCLLTKKIAFGYIIVGYGYYHFTTFIK